MMSRIGGNTPVTPSGVGAGKVHGNEKPMAEPYKASLKITTPADLISSMGSPPKNGLKIFGVLVRDSTEYKKVLSGLETYHRAYAELSNQPASSLPKSAFKDLEATLQLVINNANDYCTKHHGDPTKTDRINMMQTLVGQAVNEQHSLREMGEFQSTKHGPQVTFGDARMLFEHNIPTDLVSKTLTSETLTAEPTPLGKGALNSVSLAVFQTSETEVETRVLKPLVKEKGKWDRVNSEILTGIDHTQLKIAQRNVASASVANLLGQSSMIPPSEVVVHNGSLFLAMPLAKGEDAVVPRLDLDDLYTETGRSQERTIASGDATPEDYAGNNLVKIGKDSEGKSIYGKYVDCGRDLPFYSDVESDVTANLQQQLLDLQVIDLLCGQADRTARNYMVKISGDDVKLTAIDNDCSFGSEPDASFNLNLPHSARALPWPGLPPVISKTMYDKLMALTPGELTATLEKSGLNTDEIAQSVIRLGQLKNHAADLNDINLVVDNFKTWRDPHTGRNMSDFLHYAKSNSYVQQLFELQAISVKTFGSTVPLELEKHI